jgi:hypothetical protein
MSSESDKEKEMQQEKENSNFAGSFVQSLGHSVIQGPIDGVREIVNKCSDKEVIPKVELVKRPKKAEYGSPAWQGQQLGSAAGVIGIIIVAGRLLRIRL